MTQDQAISQLRELCDQSGGVKAFADRVGVTISAVSHQLAGRRPIQGKVAQYMGLTVQRETVLTYKKVET